MLRSERYQIALIFLGIVATILFGLFFYRELYPEYRIYQQDYIALEKFRSTYTGEPPPEFKEGVKQIIFEREDKGPTEIDRCTSCHVALQLPHFSSTKISLDINGEIIRDAQGNPVKEPNEDAVWLKLNQKIADLMVQSDQLIKDGKSSEAKKYLVEAEALQNLKSAKVGEHVYDVTKVLVMHPLIGKETRPFEFHPIEEYGCVTCHNGNGKGLTTPKAHGPVFDGQYEVEFMGAKKEFLEKDTRNDPPFSQVFNDKPGHGLLFQTTPIYVGNLIQAKCVQCHKQTSAVLQKIASTRETLTKQQLKNENLLISSYESEKKSLRDLLTLQERLQRENEEEIVKEAEADLKEGNLSTKKFEKLNALLAYLREKKNNNLSLKVAVQADLVHILGTEQLVQKLQKQLSVEGRDEDELSNEIFEAFIEGESSQTGSLFQKKKALENKHQRLKKLENSKDIVVGDESESPLFSTDIDALTKNFHRGEQLYISQSCYACHRIAGFARGGIGPELTRAGENYPWYLKESIVWPQADLKTSTMPNFHLDHVEVEDLMTFLLAQKGPNASTSPIEYRVSVQEWEAGKKMPWETPAKPSQIRDLDYSMSVFASQGCAACHRLKGFESNIGYAVERSSDSPELKIKESQWFQKIFPEEISGTRIAQNIQAYQREIDEKIAVGIRKNSLLENLEKSSPDLLESFYSNFRFALRARDAEFNERALAEKEQSKRDAIIKEHQQWKERVHNVFMIYIQEYGLGRLIGPKLNWSGVYRSDEWLMDHFKNPASHVPRSIMPVMPFDESKFFALTYMLDVLGVRNRDQVRELWKLNGFNPELAYQIHCATCHGSHLYGDGPIAPWLYPIPKNLRNAEFLRNLTKEMAIQSIQHGVNGTPMAPWGEASKDKMNSEGSREKESVKRTPVLTHEEIVKLVDWLYESLPGARVIRGIEDVPKWQYRPEDVIEELKLEGRPLKGSEGGELPLDEHSTLKRVDSIFDYYVSLNPVVYVQNKDIQAESSDPLVSNVFDIMEMPESGTKKPFYYIKDKYYTKENLERGQHFFALNCATCHGAEADGSGIRASVMTDAKPRMLTNFNWLETRDDMRLLRSIKYGVPGTSMTPWGDLTTSLQRLQLVMYIRSLTEDKRLKNTLSTALYRTFEPMLVEIDRIREGHFKHLEKVKQEIHVLEDQREDGALSENKGEKNFFDEALISYKNELRLKQVEREFNTLDELLLQLKKLLIAREEIFRSLGYDLIGIKLKDSLWQEYLLAIEENKNHLIFDGRAIEKGYDLKKDAMMKEKLSAVMAEIENELEGYLKQKTLAEGKIPSKERAALIEELNSKIKTQQLLKRKFLSGFEELEMQEKQEEKILNAYKESLKELSSKQDK